MKHGAAKNDDDDDAAAAAAAAAGIWDPGWTQGRPSCISKWSKLRRPLEKTQILGKVEGRRRRG